MSSRAVLRLVATVIVCLAICPPLWSSRLDTPVGGAGVNGQEATGASEQSLEERAEQGDADAQVELADKYFNKSVTGPKLDRRFGYAEATRGYTEAVRWYRRAAEQGHPGGQFGLGFMYSQGAGVAHDLVEAYMWISLAAKVPSKEQMVHIVGRDLLAKKMTQEQIAEAERRAQEWKPKPPQESDEPTPE